MVILKVKGLFIVRSPPQGVPFCVIRACPHKHAPLKANPDGMLVLLFAIAQHQCRRLLPELFVQYKGFQFLRFARIDY